jgi:hypothetical protein
MPQHPFPDPGPDNEEPDRSPLPPAAEGNGPAEQGLYLCRPPERQTLAGFAQNGEADTMAPGPLLATVVDTIAGPDGQGLAGCSDDQLIGIISAARRSLAVQLLVLEKTGIIRYKPLFAWFLLARLGTKRTLCHGAYQRDSNVTQPERGRALRPYGSVGLGALQGA